MTRSRRLHESSANEGRDALSVPIALRAGDARSSVPIGWGLEVAKVLARVQAKTQLREAQSEALLQKPGPRAARGRNRHQNFVLFRAPSDQSTQ